MISFHWWFLTQLNCYDLCFLIVHWLRRSQNLSTNNTPAAVSVRNIGQLSEGPGFGWDFFQILQIHQSRITWGKWQVLPKVKSSTLGPWKLLNFKLSSAHFSTKFWKYVFKIFNIYVDTFQEIFLDNNGYFCKCNFLFLE